MFEAIIVHRSLGREDWLLVFCKFLFSWLLKSKQNILLILRTR